MTKKEAEQHVFKIFKLRRGDEEFRKMVRQKMATIEHIVPSSEGGGNCQTNLVMTHAICNSKRQTARLSYNHRCFQRLPRTKQKRILKYNKKVDNEFIQN